MNIRKLLRQSINLTNTSNKVLKAKSDKLDSKNKEDSFVSFIRNNKITVFVVTFLITNILFLFKPTHIKRPEILARNRLESKN